MMMSLDQYFTLTVIAGILICLSLNVAPTAVVMAGGLLLYLFFGVISPADTLAGLSNQGMITVGLLFVVAAAIQHTGALDSAASFFLGRTKKGKMPTLILRLVMPVSFISAFLNNTPVVAIFAPILRKWSDNMGYAASKFMIPLSYAAIFGGVCTLIGTSTNLVVHGMMLSNNIQGLSMFELAKIGIPCTIAGWIYLAFFGHRLLPDRKDIFDAVKKNRKEYIVGMKVSPDCPLIGKTIHDAGLRNLRNVYLMEIERQGITFGPVSPQEKISANDILYFVGVTSGVVELEQIPGFVHAAHKMFEKDFSNISSHFIEAVISNSSPLIGRTVKEADFRSIYGAGVIAIHRNGERIKAKIGDIKLRPGDTLLLLARNEFLGRWSDSRDFYLVSMVKKREPLARRKAFLAAGIITLMVLSVALSDMLPTIGGNKISMFYAAAIAAGALILTRCITIERAKNSIQLNILLTIACAFGISKALQNSGAAEVIAGFLVGLAKGLGPLGALAAIYILTAVFTEIITHNAAAALVFPIAYSAAVQMGVNPRPFFIAIAIAASASFVTPIGYQTNLIVQGAGGYKFNDYVRAGLPLSILFFATSMFVIPLFWHF